MNRQLIFCKPNRRNGFTLVELLLALMVTSIICAAVTTLSYALGTVSDTTDNTNQKQAQVRFATLRISELIRHGKLICRTLGDDLLVWRADDNGNNLINSNELVLIERSASHNFIRLCEFENPLNPNKSLIELRTLTQKEQLTNNTNVTYATLISQCSNVRFRFDSAPPWTRFISVSFDLLEGGTTHHYHINATLRGWPDNLLDEFGNLK